MAYGGYLMATDDVRTTQRSSYVPSAAGGFPRRTVGALLGVLSGAVALGVSQLAAGMVGGASSPIVAVGSAAIDATPEWLKSLAIRTFGSHDKTALLAGIDVLLVISAIVLGIVSVRRPRVGIAGLIGFGAIGAVAAVARPANGIGAAVPSVVGAAAGIGTYLLLRRAAGLSFEDVRSPDGAGDRAEDLPSPPGFDRRRFLWTGIAATGVAGVSAKAGQLLIRRADASASRAAVRIPVPADAAPPPPAGADLGIPGLGPFITPNDLFYRVDTALFVPSVSADTWKLTVHGMVDRTMSIGYRQLLARPLVERDVTLTCVSNQVGGPYIGNARWIGAPLKDLLDEAGVRAGATQIVSRSADGFTVGTPTAVTMDGRDAMLAVGMNGEPLPLEHGFPVRMVVPGLYGYVSATKWLVDIELTTFEAYDAYWVHRGWSQQAPIKTESRIDTPKPNARLREGEVAVAGVAWAQHRGIETVEVRVDDGPWLPAELGAEDTVDTWRQWVFRWNATAGKRVLSARASDGTAAIQTATDAPPFPNGATGDHTIAVTVS
jgi:DMSO/TMAO reductase YedYZ molybdopterin-dependent catalytic subunit